MTLLARCLGHAGVDAYLSKQLMPVLRHLDAQFKEKDWQRPSAFIHALYWIVLRLKVPTPFLFRPDPCAWRLNDFFLWQHPHAGAYINPLVSLALRILDTHETSNKIVAIRILAHLLSETDASQIRWHGELLFETLKKQIVFRDIEIIRSLLPAITRCAVILEVSPGGPRNTELFLVCDRASIAPFVYCDLQEILKELEWNMKRELVPLYLAQLPTLVQHNGVHFIRYFSVRLLCR